MNTFLRNAAELTEFDAKIRIADWAEVTRRHCGDGWVNGTTPTCNWFSGDQLHLQYTGEDARNSLLLWTIAHCG